MPLVLKKRALVASLRVLAGLLFSTALFAAQPVTSKHGMVVTEQAQASRVGLQILQAGGNAIDAAVAVGYALAVVNPCCGNIGGGGFMTIHLANGKNIFLNFREKAPYAATRNLFLDKPGKSIQGYLSVAVPGTVLGLETALKKYGKLDRQRVIAPAIQLAAQGFILGYGDIKLLDEHVNEFKTQPNVAAIFLNKGKPYKIGDRLRQPQLAHTLKLISDKGSEAFYRGKIAHEIVEVSKIHGGILTLTDFQKYNVTELKPIYCTYHGYEIISAPPPSSGGVTLCEMLNILEKCPLKKLGFHTADSARYIIEAMRVAYADRNNELGDPDFVDNPIEKLTSKSYADQVRQKIHIQKHGVSPSEGNQTTHYSIIDKQGNAVSVTYTLNSFFGAQVIAGNTGFFLNNEMDDFTTRPNSKNQFGLIQGEKNAIQPGKRPLSSMTPTIIMKNKHVVMVVGSPGGPRIITSTLLTILNVLDYGLNIQDAVDSPRFHHQWQPDIVETEPNTFDNVTIKQLKKIGYKFKVQKPWGAVEAIYIKPVNHLISGGSDKRRLAGKAIGF